MSYGFAIRSSDVHQLEIYFSVYREKSFSRKMFSCAEFRRPKENVFGAGQQVLYEFFMRHVHYTTVSLHFLPLTAEAGGISLQDKRVHVENPFPLPENFFACHPHPQPTSIIHHDFNIFSHCIDKRNSFISVSPHISPTDSYVT